LESQLEDEESARQKLMLDKKNFENKLKELQERFALMQDANERLQLEKKSVDNKLVQLSDLLQEGEDKAKQGMKYRQKVFDFFISKRFFSLTFSKKMKNFCYIF